MQTILVLGSKGMLGQELVKQLSEKKDIELLAWDREECDVVDFSTLRSKIMEVWPDVIYNCVAYNAVDLCETSREERAKAELLNTKLPGELADIANDLQATLVHYSTDYVFDGERPRHRDGKAPGCCGSGCSGCSYKGPEETFDGYREEDLPNPLNIYGKTKYEGERLVEKTVSQCYIIRLSKLFGTPGTGEGAKKSFFEVMLEKGATGDVVKAVDGEKSCFTYAPDLAKASIQLVQEKKPFGIYHIINDGHVTWYEAVRELYRQSDIDVDVEAVSPETFPRPANRPSYSVLINMKTDPLRLWRDALKDFLKNR